MKNLLVVAAMVMAAAPAAMASKARVDALANSRQIVDIQNAFDRPYQFMALGTMATIEWGESSTTLANSAGKTHAEGGFLMKSDDMAYGAYLGRRADAFTLAVANSGVTGLLLEQNPINLYYASKMGDWTWGVTVKYSNGKDDTGDLKASSTGLALGAQYGAWEFEITQGLSGKTENATQSVESKGFTQLGVGYKINENMEAYANYGMAKAEFDNAGATSDVLDRTAYEVGFINTVVKTEETNFFYGVAYNSTKDADDSEETTLPVWMGIEANATSWMVARASVKQNILINSDKDISGGANDGDVTDADSITFAAGAGIKLGKGMLDVSFGNASKAGNVDFADAGFLTQAAYTYNF